MDNQFNTSNQKDAVKLLGLEQEQVDERQLEFIKKKQKFLESIVLEISRFSDLEIFVKTTVHKLRILLKNDRVIIYKFQQNGRGKIVAESVVDSQWSILGTRARESYFQEQLVKYYQQNLTEVENDNLTPCFAELFTDLQVKANLFVPILLKNNQLLETGKKQNNFSPSLWGLLIVQNCSYPRNWQSDEVEILQQLSTHLSIAIQQDLLYNKLVAEQENCRLLETDLQETKKQLEVKKSNRQLQLENTKNFFQEEPEKLHLLIESIRDYGIFMLDSKANIITGNLGAEKITGYQETDIIGKNFFDLCCQANVKPNKLQQALEIAVKTGRYEGEELIIRQDSVKICCSIIITAFDNQVKEIQGFAVVMRDLTKNSELEIRLKLLEKAILSSSNGILITDATQPHNPIIYVNPGFEKITGYNAQEVIGKNARFLQGEETQQPALEWLRASLKAGTHVYVTLKNYRKDRTVFGNELTISPIRDEQGNLTHYVGVQKDITEKVEAEKERDRFFELSIDMLCIANFDGYFVKLNQVWQETLGYSEEELLTQPFINFVHPEDREITQAELKKITQGRNTISFENRYQCKDGSYRWLMWNATPSLEQKMIYAVAHDITQLKETEKALRKREERFRTVADFAYDWESWLNPQRKFIYVSPSCERITGYTPNEFMENTELLQIIVHPKDRKIVNQYFADHFEQEKMFSMNFRIITRGGQTKWIGHCCQSVYSTDGQWLGRRVSNRDITKQKQMEIALQENEYRFRSIFNQAGVGIVQATATGELVLFNQKFVDLVKYSPEELRQKKLEELIHPDDLQIYRQQIAKLWLDKNQSVSSERRYIGQDGSIVWVHVSGAIIENVSGKPQYYIAVIQDISDRKQAESAFQENQNLLNEAEKLAHLGSWQYDISRGEITKITWSDELFHIFGLLVGQHFSYTEMLGWYYPEDAEYLDKLVKQAILQGKPYSIEAQIIRRDGKTRHIFSKGQPVFNQEGETIKLFGTVQDITNRKRAELALRESEERFRLMADSAPVLIWVSGIDAKCNYFNKNWLKFTGRTFDEELGDGWIQGVHPEDLDRCLKTYMNGFNARQHFRMEYRLRRADGEYRWLLDEGVPRFTANGEFAGYIGCCIDITDNKENQEKLHLWIDELELRNQEMVLLGKINEFLQVCSSAQEAEKMLGDLLQPLFPDCAGSIFRMVTGENILAMVASWGECVNNLPIFTPSECWALRRGRVHLVEADSPSLLCQHIKTTSRPAKSLCIPMIANGETLGLIQLTAIKPEGLTEAKQQLARAVAENLALALANLELRETLKNQSIRDPLTGLYNRRYLEEFLEQEIHRAKRNQESVGVVMLDIDRFKQFNDNFGHDAGDLVLQEVGKTLMNAVRKSDVACRYGGEELTLILPGASLEEAQKRAEDIRLAIKKLRLRHRETTLDSITASFGVACYPQHGSTFEQVIQTADAALYDAKKQGRDRTVVAEFE